MKDLVTLVKKRINFSFCEEFLETLLKFFEDYARYFYRIFYPAQILFFLKGFVCDRSLDFFAVRVYDVYKLANMSESVLPFLIMLFTFSTKFLQLLSRYTRATVNALEKENYNPSLELAFRLSLYFKKIMTF